MRTSSLVHETRSQGATEYMVIIGGIILVTVVVSLFIKSQFSATTQMESRAGEKLFE